MTRFLRRSSWLLTGHGLAAVGGLPVCVACAQADPSRQGQLMLAVSTDLDVPRDVDSLQIEVLTFGSTQFSHEYELGSRGLKLPATLGIVVGDDPATPVNIRVLARQGTQARFLRDVVTTVPADRLATLEVKIEWLCLDEVTTTDELVSSSCGENRTCIAGECTSVEVDSAALPDYELATIFGGGDGAGTGECFDTLACFASGRTIDVDLDRCAAPLGGASEHALSIALAPSRMEGICGREFCLVPLDAHSNAGWRREGEEILLPRAVCAKILEGELLGVVATTACPQKTTNLPTCGLWSSIARAATTKASPPSGLSRPTEGAAGGSGGEYHAAGAPGGAAAQSGLAGGGGAPSGEGTGGQSNEARGGEAESGGTDAGGQPPEHGGRGPAGAGGATSSNAGTSTIGNSAGIAGGSPDRGGGGSPSNVSGSGPVGEDAGFSGTGPRESAGGSPQGGGSGETGGITTGATGGSGGTQEGGAPGETGGITTGATGGSGGTEEGGTSGTGGSVEDPTAEPELITSGPGGYWQEGDLAEVTDAATVTVDETLTYQIWDGFGGTFNEVGWDVLSLLGAADRSRALQLLFDARDGAGFTYGRIPIGSSDFSLERYSLCETAGDTTMETFSIEHDRLYLIPYIRAALAVKPDIRLWASPWSPPPWMKDNNAYDRGSINSDPETLQAHALYLARFVEEYAAEGIDVEAIHPQNEPGYLQDYPSCGWSPEVMTDYIAHYLGPTFEERSVSAEIWLGTMSNPTDTSIVEGVLSDPAAASFVRGIGLQWNMDPYAAGYVSEYGLSVMQTEHKCGNYPWETATFQPDKAPNDHAYAQESWGFLTTWIRAGVNSYLAWNMVLDTVGLNMDQVRPWPQNALLTVDPEARTLTVTPAYYVFRHLAQYVEPGAVRLGASGGDALAFRNPDGSIVTVLYNAAAQDAQTTLSAQGRTVQFVIPGTGWATVNLQ